MISMEEWSASLSESRKDFNVFRLDRRYVRIYTCIITLVQMLLPCGKRVVKRNFLQAEEEGERRC